LKTGQHLPKLWAKIECPVFFSNRVVVVSFAEPWTWTDPEWLWNSALPQRKLKVVGGGAAMLAALH